MVLLLAWLAWLHMSNHRNIFNIQVDSLTNIQQMFQKRPSKLSKGLEKVALKTGCQISLACDVTFVRNV